MNRLIFIRHGATSSNLSRKYIGRTDEPLCEAGIKQIEELKKESFCVDAVFVSPLLRARQSAEILFPGMEYTVIDDFRETDFGMFEGKSADELSDSPEYSAWVDSWCKGPVPDGESSEHFKARCCDAFARVMDFLNKNDTAAFVVHGGVIMAIMERYAVPRKDFYAYHIANGEWISCVHENGIVSIEARF